MAHIPRSNQVSSHHNASYTTGHGGQLVNVAYSQPAMAAYPQTTPHIYENVSPSYSVKYPPSMDPTARTVPGELPRSSSQQVPVAEISKQLDFATRENMRLKQAVEENNHFLEQKLQEFVLTQNQSPQVRSLELEIDRLRGLEKEVKRLKGLEEEANRLKGKVSEATNRFFEARVAVMGFKCKVMQLQGQLDKQQHTNSGKEPRDWQDEQKSLIAVTAQLKEDLVALASKKSIVEEERDRLKQDNTALHQQMGEKDAFTQQLQSQYRQNTHDHTLRGQVQELLTKKLALEGEVGRTKQGNDQLLYKVKEMQESREVMMQKLERLESMSPTGGAAMPMAKPRSSGRIEQELLRLQEENASLVAERDQLRLDRDRAHQGKNAVDAMFQECNKKSQNLTGENMNLRRDIEKLEVDLQRSEEEQEAEKRRKEDVERNMGAEVSQALEKALEESEALRGELRSLGKEKSGQVARVTRLERLNKEGEGEREQLKQSKDHMRSVNQKNRKLIAELEERVAAGPAAESAELKSYTSMKSSAAKRLNDALGKIRELEVVKGGLVEELEDLKETNAMKVRQLRSQLEGLEEELRVEREEESKIASEDLSELQSETVRLRGREEQLCLRVQLLESEQQRHMEESLHMRSDLDRHRQDLAHDDSAKRDLSRQVSEKDSEVVHLKEQVGSLQDQIEAEVKNKSKSSSKLDSLQQNFSEQKRRHQAQSEEKQTHLQVLGEEKDRILAEKEEIQNMCEEFRKESESILLDYNMCAQRLKVSEETTNRLTALHQKDLTDQARMRERVSLLEQSRKEQDEKLNHMDQQIKIYHEDFDRERNAREAAVKVKNLAEDRMKKMDRELKELRDRLNQQAVRSLREEPYEDGSYSSSSPHMDTMSSQRYSGPHTKSGEQYPGSQPPTTWNAPAPGSGAQQHHHVPPQQEQRRSGEMSQIPGPLQGGMESIPILPPSHCQGGGYAAGGRMPPYRAGGGGQVPPSNAWTTVNPPSTQAPHYHHVNKTTLDRTLDRPSDRTLDRPSDRTLVPMGGLPPSIPGRRDPIGALPPSAQGRRDPMGALPPSAQGPGRREGMGSSMPGRRELHVEYSQPGGGGGVNDINNPPSVHMPDTGINDLSFRPPAPQGPSGRMEFQPLEPPMLRQGGMDPGNFGVGGQPLITLPGEINNTAPPTMACPICNRDNFKTQTDLELHSAQCM